MIDKTEIKINDSSKIEFNCYFIIICFNYNKRCIHLTNIIDSYICIKYYIIYIFIVNYLNLFF
jgi:hypothetical protein